MVLALCVVRDLPFPRSPLTDVPLLPSSTFGFFFVRYLPSFFTPPTDNEGLHRLAEFEGKGIYGSPLEWLDVQINGWSHTAIQACELNSTTGCVSPPLLSLHSPY
jgi:hypothetical protein